MLLLCFLLCDVGDGVQGTLIWPVQAANRRSQGHAGLDLSVMDLLLACTLWLGLLDG